MKRKIGENEEKNEGERQGKKKKKKKKREREKSTDIGSVDGSHKQLKNIKWWQVSDGAKRGGVF